MKDCKSGGSLWLARHLQLLLQQPPLPSSSSPPVQFQFLLVNGHRAVAPSWRRKPGTNERGKFRGRVIWKFLFVGAAQISRLLFPELSELPFHGLLLLCEHHICCLPGSGAPGILKLLLLKPNRYRFSIDYAETPLSLLRRSPYKAG